SVWQRFGNGYPSAFGSLRIGQVSHRPYRFCGLLAKMQMRDWPGAGDLVSASNQLNIDNGVESSPAKRWTLSQRP
ncbi:hypothetical protein ABTL42_19595, partial [Acinetobacter baumannii]